MVKILVSDPIHRAGIERLEQLGQVEVKVGLPREELVKSIKGQDVLVVRSATQVTREVIEAGENLKVIARAGMGLDNIDVGAAQEHGIKVVNAPEAPSVAVAELVFGLILGWVRHIPQADLSMKHGKWEKSKLMGSELRGKTLGIVGTGRIGREVAIRAKAFGMNLLAHDIVQNEELVRQTGARYVDMETLLRESDFVTLHVPFTEQTERMIGKRELELMKPTAVLINTARGGVVDEQALAEVLQSGRIAGACLDVYEREPLGDSPLLGLPNVVLTPHLGASTEETQREAALIVAEKIKKALGR